MAYSLRMDITIELGSKAHPEGHDINEEERFSRQAQKCTTLLDPHQTRGRLFHPSEMIDPPQPQSS